jgi:POT family proton-dependent oligopeptide transporter
MSQADTPNAKPRHPKELIILFASEMWERFGFYTAAALMTLYLQYGGFGWKKEDATTLWSYYLMFVYATPLIGGWLADKFIGYRRSVIIGGVVFVLGYGMLAVGQVATFWLALILIFIGNGFFKPNISTMVGNLYPAGSPLKDSAYNIFYMGINVGAFTAPIVAEAIRQRIVPDEVYRAVQNGVAVTAAQQEQVRNSFLMGFVSAAIGMTLGTILLCLFYKALAKADRRKQPHDAQQAALTEDIAPHADVPAIEKVPARTRVAALIVIFALVIVFWMVFHQNGTTMTYWADKNTDWKNAPEMKYVITALSLGTVDSSQASGVISNAINPFWIVVLSMPLVAFWNFLGRRGLEPSTPTKMALGMLLTAAAFFILYIAAMNGGNQTFQLDPTTGERVLNAQKVPIVKEGLVSPWWLIMAYCVLSLGELCLSPMGLSLVSKVAPAHMRGLMMGGWFVATAIGNKLTMIGVLWDYWLHSDFWLLCSGLAAVMAVVFLLLLKPLKRAMPGV